MTLFLPKTTKCNYRKADGSTCGAICIRDICAEHMRCAPLKKCLNCHRGTQSITGYCGAEGDCRTKQRSANSRILRQRKAYEARKKAVLMDMAVDDLMRAFNG